MIEVEHRRIRAAFRRATLASLLASACSGTAPPADVTDASDATTGVDATDATIDGADVDASSAPADEAATDAGDESDPLASGPCARTPTDAALDADLKCGRFWALPCGVPSYANVRADCTFPPDECPDLCNYESATECQVVGAQCGDAGLVSEAGPIAIYCDLCLVGGRRPPGLRAEGASRRDIGGYFAELARLEAASVPAFRRMVGELRALGAPRALVRAAARATRDELRHARMTTRLARRFGAHPRPLRLAVVPNRSLEALAYDNEIEGCVREAFAALIVDVQARRATDPDVARTLAHVAADESRHAALSFAISRWVRARSSPQANAWLDEARRREIARLDAALASTPRASVAVAGLPSSDEQRDLLRSLRATLWAS